MATVHPFAQKPAAAASWGLDAVHDAPVVARGVLEALTLARHTLRSLPRAWGHDARMVGSQLELAMSQADQIVTGHIRTQDATYRAFVHGIGDMLEDVRERLTTLLADRPALSDASRDAEAES